MENSAAKNYEKVDKIPDACTWRTEEIAEALVLRLL
jgi:hypothetical protein